MGLEHDQSLSELQDVYNVGAHLLGVLPLGVGDVCSDPGYRLNGKVD